jgi:hypothetical protein
MEGQVVIEKFLKVTKRVGSCLHYLGFIQSNGYGQFRKPGGKMELAHRVSYEIFKGPIPDGMLVLHTCDVRHCVEPEHLFLGTHKDNFEDCANKGRVSPRFDNKNFPKSYDDTCRNGHIRTLENTKVRPDNRTKRPVYLCLDCKKISDKRFWSAESKEKRRLRLDKKNLARRDKNQARLLKQIEEAKKAVPQPFDSAASAHPPALPPQSSYQASNSLQASK